MKKILTIGVNIEFLFSFFQRKMGDRSDTEDEASKFSPKVQVVAASGDNIIAVANPALAMSPAINPSLTTIIEKRNVRAEID